VSLSSTSFRVARDAIVDPRALAPRLAAFRVVLSTMFRADPIRTVASLLLRPANSVAPIIAAMWLKFVIDDALTARSANGSLVLVAIGLGVTFSGVVLSSWLSLVIDARLQESATHAFDHRVAAASLALPSLDILDIPEYRDRLELIKEDSASLSSTVSAAVDVIASGAAAVFASILLLSVSPVMLLLIVAALPALVVGKKAEGVRQRVLIDTAEPARAASDIFDLATSARAGKEIRALGIQTELLRRYETASAAVVVERRRAWNLWAIWRCVSWLPFVAAFGGVLIFVVNEAATGRMTAGDVVLVFIIGRQANVAISNLAYTVTHAVGAFHSADRLVWLERVARVASQKEAEEHRTRTVAKSSMTVQLDEVGFAYPDGTIALRDINLTLRSGSVTAIVGENGAGKTTLVRLLAGFYEPTEGAISVDGTSRDAFDLSSWWPRVSGVLQDHGQFELLAEEVVGVGDVPRMNDVGAVRSALSRAGADGLFEEFPAGGRTALGVSFGDGFQPSGGQWQKLALSRGMMREAPLLLVLDEPTSALDPIAEERLLQSYVHACKVLAESSGAIVVITSHRLSTVGVADEIIVVEKGTVVESGSHAALLRLGGRYAELFHLQSAAFEGA
jgi:ATP-binding cassette subfamily B protein